MPEEVIFDLLQALLEHGLLRPRSVAHFGRICLAERDNDWDTPIAVRRLILQILAEADSERLLWSDAPEFRDVFRGFVNPGRKVASVPA